MSLKKTIFYGLLLLCAVGFPLSAFSQEKNDAECKVLLKELVGSYQGACKNGLAHGKGFAKGIDSYFGLFKEGLPSGKGVYTYKNGDIFVGTWKNGQKNGEGEFRYLVNGKDSVLSGIWKADVYKGPLIKEGYRVTNFNNIEYNTVKKTADSLNVVEISFERLGRKYIPSDLSLTITSGYRVPDNRKVVVLGYQLPITCSLRYTIATSGGIRQCNYDLMILEPGKWEALIFN